MCAVIYRLVRWVSEYGRGLAFVERAWNVLAVLIVLSAFLVLRRQVGLNLNGTSNNTRVRLAFLPFVNWKPHVPPEHWPAMNRAGRRIRFVMIVYLLALVAVLLYILGLSTCPPVPLPQAPVGGAAIVITP